jgi:hypothetical protein
MNHIERFLHRQAQTSRIAYRDFKKFRTIQERHPIKFNITKCYDEEYDNLKKTFYDIIAEMKEDNPLTQRIAELKELSQGMYPDTPDWYIAVAVEAYIRKEESELLTYLQDHEEAMAEKKKRAEAQPEPEAPTVEVVQEN